MADLAKIAERVLLGEPLAMISSDYRESLLTDLGLDPEEASGNLFVKETNQFMNKLCRHLGDRHAGNVGVATALEDWVRRVDEYEVFDTLLVHFEFPSRPAVLERGRMLFPGSLTDHWGDCETEM